MLGAPVEPQPGFPALADHLLDEAGAKTACFFYANLRAQASKICPCPDGGLSLYGMPP